MLRQRAHLRLVDWIRGPKPTYITVAGEFRVGDQNGSSKFHTQFQTQPQVGA